MHEKELKSSYLALRVALGVVPIVAGADKFTNLLADWPSYLSPAARALLPVSPELFMRAAGIIEIAVGLGILLGFARLFGWVAMAWLAAIAVNLILSGHFLDVAARDAVMAVAAFALARLAEVCERAPAHEVPHAATPARAGV